MSNLKLTLCLLLPLASLNVKAQSYGLTMDMANGEIPFESYDVNQVDSVNLMNGDLSLHIPLVQYPQVGGALKWRYSATYDSKASHAYFASCQGSGACNWLWTSGSECLTCNTGSIGPNTVTVQPEGLYAIQSRSFPTNTSPPVQVTVYSACSSDGCHLMEADSTGVYRSIDATGLRANLAGAGQVIDKDGTQYFAGVAAGVVARDVYGNTISRTSTGYTDTMGRNTGTGLGWPGAGNGCQPSWTPPGPNGGTLTFTLCKTGSTYTALIPPSSGSATTFVNGPATETLSLPDGRSWQFTFGGPAGEISQITLPTGGTISYGYAPFYRMLVSTGSGRPDFSNFVTSLVGCSNFNNIAAQMTTHDYA